VKDRLVGCIVAGAIGDALGGPYEGQDGPVVVDPLRVSGLSDDTQLTLATCEGIRARDDVEPQDVADRYLTWFRQRRISGVGASTLKALRDLDAGAHWALSGRSGEYAAGNGAAMRVAPLAFCLDSETVIGRTCIRDICRITHRNDEAYVGALAIVRAINLVATGGWEPGSNLPRQAADGLPDSKVCDALHVIAGLAADMSVVEAAQIVGCSAYVAESVPLAIFASQRVAALNLRDLLVGTIEAGGDTDTIASMVGQIAGAWLGFERVPRDLVERVDKSGEVVRTASELADRLAAPFQLGDAVT